MKKILLVGMLIGILVCTTMCQEEQDEITKENIGQHVADAYTTVTTYKIQTHMQMDMTMQMQGEETSMTMVMKMDSAVDEQHAKQKSDFSMNVNVKDTDMNYTLDGETYIEGNTFYMKMLGDWYKKELEDASALNQTKALEDLLTSAEILMLEETTLDGKDAYHLTLQSTLSQLLKMYKETQTISQQLGTAEGQLNIAQLEKSIKDYTVEYWISKTTHRIVKSVVTMDLEMTEIPGAQGATTDGTLTLTTSMSSYNAEVVIDMPEDAKFAKDWEDFMSTYGGETSEEQVSGELHIVNVTNDDKKFYIMIYNNTGYTLVTDNGNGTMDVGSNTSTSEVRVVIKNSSHHTIVNQLVTESGDAMFLGGETTFYHEGHITVSVPDITPEASYTITVTAANTTTTATYTAV